MGLGPKGLVLAKIFEADLEGDRIYFDKMRGAAARSVSIGEDHADDFVQDLYLVTMKAAESYRYEIGEDVIGCEIKGPLNTWLWWRFFGLRDKYNTMRSRRHGALKENEDRSEGRVSAKVINEERHNIVLEMIGKLPSMLRDVAVLKYYIGKNAKEIGEMIGETASNVRMRLCKVRNIFRESNIAHLVG